MDGFKKQEKNKLEFEGKVFENQGEPFTILQYFNTRNITVQFEDGTVVIGLQLNNLKNGRVINPNSKTCYNIGFLGQGNYLPRNNKKVYQSWNNMLSRCYSSIFLEKHPSYQGCSVHPDWHNFQNFASWFLKNQVESFDLDKDILFKGNKIYGPETCCFVPGEINRLFTKSNRKRGNLPIGVCTSDNKFRSYYTLNNKIIHLGVFDTPEKVFEVYKTAKETEIKRLADKWRGSITPECYIAIYNYKVQITD